MSQALHSDVGKTDVEAKSECNRSAGERLEKWGGSVGLGRGLHCSQWWAEGRCSRKAWGDLVREVADTEPGNGVVTIEREKNRFKF